MSEPGVANPGYQTVPCQRKSHLVEKEADKPVTKITLGGTTWCLVSRPFMPRFPQHKNSTTSRYNFSVL